MSSECPFCRLAHGDLQEQKTNWLWLNHEGICVVDLDSKGHALRLLYVPTEHIPCGSESGEIRAKAYKILQAIAQAIGRPNGWGISGWDFDQHSFAEHWHAQVCLDEIVKKREPIGVWAERKIK